MPAAPQEVRIAGRRLRLTNLDKVMYPETGTTKGEVIDYLTRIAPAMLPHLDGRPVTRIRWPDGTGEGSFFAKHLEAGARSPGLDRVDDRLHARAPRQRDRALVRQLALEPLGAEQPDAAEVVVRSARDAHLAQAEALLQQRLEVGRPAEGIRDRDRHDARLARLGEHARHVRARDADRARDLGLREAVDVVQGRCSHEHLLRAGGRHRAPSSSVSADPTSCATSATQRAP